MWWVLGLVGVACASWGIISARRLLYPDRQSIPAPTPLPSYSTHALNASDGAPFDVWLLDAPTPRARLLFCHGYSANRHQLLRLAHELRERGYEAILFELRGHGGRPGPHTFGVRETEDALTVLEWAQRRTRALPVGVIGWSMGAAIACQVSARCSAVRAVVADSLFSNLFPLLQRFVTEQYRLPPLPLAWVTRWTIECLLRRRLTSIDPATLASSLQQPLLAIQGGADERVPPRWSELYYARWAGPKERWFEPSIAHVKMFEAHPQAYRDRVAGFFDRVFAGADG